MQRATVIVSTLAGVGACAGIAAGSWLYVHRDPDPEATAARQLMHKYCVDCHNPLDFAGSLRLDNKDLGRVGPDAEIWEHVVRKLETGMMPPAGRPRPPRKTLDRLVANAESRLDQAALTAGPPPPATSLHRLNRTEYANAIRDLLNLDIDPATLLPLDDSSEGFDNIASSLGVSPSLVEAYVSAAMKISRRALGDPTTPRSQSIYTAPQNLAQDRHLEGLPLGTRGGLRIEHDFPLDADYEIRIRGGFRLPKGTRVDVTLDGAPLEVADTSRFRFPVSAGPHVLTAALVDAWRPAGVDGVYAEFSTPGAIQGIEIDGPLDATGLGDTPSRRRILICEPAPEADEPCAERIVSQLAKRAFRGPVSREEIAGLMEFYDAGRKTGHGAGGFEAGIQHALSRILVDPRFLYRIERDPAAPAPGTVYEIGDFELAARLSFFLWSSIPDDELLGLAGEGRLHEPATLVAQVERMLADPKADALVDNFAAQWLLLRELDSVTPAADAFDENLREAMMTETKLFFRAIMRENLSLLRLLDADFTFLNDRLAAHYGIPGVHGSYFRKVQIPADNPRRGLLGQASVLTLTSVTSRTSPVIRGRWVLETLLGAPPPSPPPNVNTTLAGDDGPAATASVRERLEAHRRNPNCASCHAIMDPIGFALENFDLIGAWRDTEGGRPIDTSGTLTDGTVLDGSASLRDALLDRSDAFVTTATEKLLTYALGRRLEYYDMPAVRAIVKGARAEDYRFSTFVIGVVKSRPFLTKVKGASE
jgi:mono/diheme cytochrome c family protein